MYLSDFWDIQELYGEKFTIFWHTFNIDAAGYVFNADGEALGHLEECLEDGKAFFDLMELIYWK